jgi:hypothetical protein
MKNWGQIGNKGWPLARDTMELAVHLEGNMTVRDVQQMLEQPEQQNVTYVVFPTRQGAPFGVVTRQGLRTANENARLQGVTRDVLSAQSVSPDETLDTIMQKWTDEFASNPEVKGILVQEQGNVLGVLPRERIEEFVQRFQLEEKVFGDIGGQAPYRFPSAQGQEYAVTEYSHGAAGRLEGDFLFEGTPKMTFVCPDCLRGEACPDGPEERAVDLEKYNPDDPPKCKRYRHTMVLK